MADGSKRQRFPAYLRVRTPETLMGAVERAANEKMTSSSEYVRQAILARLKSDGFQLSPTEAA
jgi:hypothetical protein